MIGPTPRRPVARAACLLAGLGLAACALRPGDVGADAVGDDAARAGPQGAHALVSEEVRLLDSLPAAAARVSFLRAPGRLLGDFGETPVSGGHRWTRGFAPLTRAVLPAWGEVAWEPIRFVCRADFDDTAGAVEIVRCQGKPFSPPGDDAGRAGQVPEPRFHDASLRFFLHLDPSTCVVGEEPARVREVWLRFHRSTSGYGGWPLPRTWWARMGRLPEACVGFVRVYPEVPDPHDASDPRCAPNRIIAQFDPLPVALALVCGLDAEAQPVLIYGGEGRSRVDPSRAFFGPDALLPPTKQAWDATAQVLRVHFPGLLSHDELRRIWLTFERLARPPRGLLDRIRAATPEHDLTRRW